MISPELEDLKVPARYNIDELTSTEFSKLKGQHYLDHAAATLYGESQLEEVFLELQTSLLGNPHSRHPPSDAATQSIEAVRQRILEHFNTTAEEYDVIFTSGATAALKLVAECFSSASECVRKDISTSPQNTKDGKSYEGPAVEKTEKKIGNENVMDQMDLVNSKVRDSGAKIQSNKNEVNVTDGKENTNNDQEKNITGQNYIVQLDVRALEQRNVKEEDNTKDLNSTVNQNNQEPEIVCKNGCRGVFVYASENHTSVLGMRGTADRAGCDVYSIPSRELENLLGKELENTGAAASTKNYILNEEMHIDSKSGDKLIDNGYTSPIQREKLGQLEAKCNIAANGNASPIKENKIISQSGAKSNVETKRLRNCLFTYSGQCNFSGAKYPLGWTEKVHDGALNDVLHRQPINDKKDGEGKMKGDCCEMRWFVVLDAASLVATSPLDLSQMRPDFVPVSFYKMFGYPTGLGCLLVSRRAWGCLKKEYHGGGTVMMADSRNMTLVPRTVLHDRFEDGTLPFLSILAVRNGLDTLSALPDGMVSIRQHTFHLARYTHHSLRSLRHPCGSPVAHIYCPGGDMWHTDSHGSIVNFNLLQADGSHVGYAQVERVASLYNIHLRTGCLCNPGACQTYLNISQDQLHRQFEAGHVCGDARDLVDGLPTGSVRVSFGYMSTYEDADQLLKMVQECFIQGTPVVDTSWMNGVCNTTPGCNFESTKPGFDVDVKCKNVPAVTNGVNEICTLECKQFPPDSGKCKKPSNQIISLSDDKILKATEGKGNLMNNEKSISIWYKDSTLSTENSFIHSHPEAADNGVKDNNMNQENEPHSNILPKNHSSPGGNLRLTSINQQTEQQSDILPNNHSSASGSLWLTDIFIYPVKSCGGMRVSEWRVTDAGLEYDRGWMVVTESGVTLTQKRLPQMSLIVAQIDLKSQMLVLTCQGASEVIVPLTPPASTKESEDVGVLCGGRVCGDRVKGQDSGGEVGVWLSRVLGVAGLRLMRQTTHRVGRLHSQLHGVMKERLSLVNESQLLILHRPSIRHLLSQICDRGGDCEQLTEDELVGRFRANLVMEGGEAYEEDSWTSLSLGSTTLKVQGGCRRCQMVCVSPGTGQRTKEPLLTLAATRGSNMNFGVHATTTTASATVYHEDSQTNFSVGFLVVPVKTKLA